MPTQDQEFAVPGTAVVSGWGTIFSGGPSPDVLRFVEVPLVTDEGMKYRRYKQFLVKLYLFCTNALK